MNATPTTFRWWSDDCESDRHEVVGAVIRLLYERDEERRLRLERAARLHGPGIALGRWKPPATGQGAAALNLIRTLVHTAASNVIDKPPPRPLFATDGGDYEMQQRAEGMTKLASGTLYQTGFDALARPQARLAALAGKVPFKIYELDGRPCIESVNPWQVLVDEVDGAEGKPRSLYQIAWIDRDVLKARYPDQEDDLDKAKNAGIDDEWGQDTVTDQVCVLEAWHLPSGKGKKDGRHVLCVDTCTLVDEPWEDDYFPFAWLEWQKPVGSFWGAGIADELWPTQYELNLCVERKRQMLHRLAKAFIFLMNGTKITPSPLDNQVASIWNVMGQQPIFMTPQAVPPELERNIDFWWVKGFQQLGISEQAAMAMKPAGLNSGKAQLVHADLTSGRLSEWGLNWQDCYTEVSRQTIRLQRRIADKHPGLEVTYLDPYQQELERIRWEDVNLDEDAYVLQCFPISSLPSTPQGRIAQLDSWRADGIIDDAEYRRLLNMPDLKGSMSMLNGPRDQYEKIITGMLYGKGRYVQPDSYDDFALARRVASFHLLRARARGVPESRLMLVRDFIVALDNEQAKAAAPAKTPAPPPGAPMPPGPGGAPLPPDMMPPPDAVPMAA